MVDAAELEKLMKPTITVCHDKFERAARLHAEALGMPALPLLIEPAPASGNIASDVAHLARAAVSQVIGALCSGVRAAALRAGQ